MKHFAILLLAGLSLDAQSQPSRAFVGTVTAIRPETAEMEIQADKGATSVVKLTLETRAQKIAPGARDLKDAENIEVTDLAKGDRVLITLYAGSSEVLRVVVMPAVDITKRDESDRLDWQKRGVGGVVSGKSANGVTVKTRAMTGDVEAIITVNEQTSFKRYAPNSVRFSDAQPSKLAEISVGDQVRARGVKSEDGLNVRAEEVVFGTFLVKGGVITAVNPESKEIIVKEMNTNKTLLVSVTPESQIKQMPNMPAGMMGRGSPGGMRGNLPARGGPPGGFDINQMLERMPLAKLEDLKPGSTVVISSTKPTKSDQLTAIVVLANADMLIQMASMMSGGDRGGNALPSGLGQGMGGNMMGGDSGGFGGLGLSGMVP